MTIIPAKSSIEKTCVKSLSSTCVFPQHFVMKFFKHTKKLKQFYSNIHVSTIHILPLTSYFVTHLSIYGVILFLDVFQSRFITAFSFVNKTHIETCKTAQSENNLMKECLALFEPILSELVKSILTLQLLVLRCFSVSPFSSSIWGSGQHLEGWFPAVHTAVQLHVLLVCLWHVLSVAVLISAPFYSDELLRARFVSEPAASFMSILPVCLKWQVYILLYN